MNYKRPIDILVCGYLCVDLIPVFDAASQASTVGFEGYFKPGTLTELKGMSFTIGGIVGNTGLVLHKIGKNVHLSGLVGKDHLGELIINQFDKYKVSHNLVTLNEEGTSFGIVLAPPGVDRMFLEFPGCSRHFNLNHIDPIHLQQSKVLHFGYLPLLNNFFNHDGDKLEQLLRSARAHGTVTAMDLCLPDEQGEGKGIDWNRILKQVLPYTDIITPSIEEILFMLKPALYEELTIQFGNQIIDHISYEIIQQLGRQLISYGAKIVLIKLAHQGLYLLTDEMHDGTGQSILSLNPNQWNHQEHYQPAYQADTAKIKSASGAGDTSIAAFLAALLDQESPEQALKLCAMAGRESLYCNDLYTEFPDWEEIKNTINTEEQIAL